MSSIYECLSRDTIGASDTLCAMMQKEQRTERNCYLLDQTSSSSSTSDADVVTGSDRMMLVDWCYSIVDKCGFERETVAVAMEMVDRFLSKPDNAKQEYLCDRTQYQLLTVGALYISIKISEPVAFGSDVFAATSKGIYSVQEIEEMEITILKGLDWRIHMPTSIQMAHYILSVVMPQIDLEVEQSTWEFILDEVRYQTEYAVRDYYFSTQRPSTVAMAAIFNALDQVNHQVCYQVVNALLSIMNEHIASDPDEIIAAKNRLANLIDDDECIREGVEETDSVTTSYNDGAQRENDSISPKTSPRAVTPTIFFQQDSSLRERADSS